MSHYHPIPIPERKQKTGRTDSFPVRGQSTFVVATIVFEALFLIFIRFVTRNQCRECKWRRTKEADSLDAIVLQDNDTSGRDESLLD